MTSRPVDIDNSGLVRRHVVTNFSLPDGTEVAKAYSNNLYIDYVLYNNDENEVSIANFLEVIKHKIVSIFSHELNVKKFVKCNMFLSILYVNIIDVTMRFAYKSRNSILYALEDSEMFLQDHFQQLLQDVENRELKQSGWSLLAIQHLEVRISKYKPIPGRSFVPLPRWIKLKRAVLSIKNDDDFCFKYAILAIHLKSIGQKATFPNFRKYENAYNFNINFPPFKKDVLKFCSLNKVSLHLFGLEEKNFYPMIISKKTENSHFNILYYETHGKAHYYPIYSLSRLLGSQINKHGKTKFFCLRCLLSFDSQFRLDVHTEMCGNEILTKVVLPENEQFFKFDRFDAIQQNYIIMTLDFEAFLIPIDTCQPREHQASTTFTHKHELASFGAYLKCTLKSKDTSKVPKGYYGKISKNSQTVENELVEYLYRVARGCAPFFACDYPLHMSEEQEANFQASTACYICYKPFTDDSNYRVRDHCHFISKNNYRGSAHTLCNIKARKNKFIPCYVHCLGQYDAHFLVKIFTERKIKIRIIPHTIEKYISFTIILNGVMIKFLDSFLLFHTKLETVLESLPKEYFHETKKNFPTNSHELIMGKLPYPYSFLTNRDNLDFESYPDKIHFTNDLTGEPITEELYARGQDIWNLFDCKSFAEFTAIYQMTDSILLADGILYLRQIIFEKFGVELTCFLSLAQVAVTCMLKLSKTQIQVFDQSMQDAYDLVSRGCYGGLVTCNKRFVEATETRHLNVADFNSLYLFCLDNFKMPISGYKFVDKNLKDWSIASTNGNFNYVLEIDLYYPTSIHDKLNDLVPTCERKVPPGARTARLVSDFSPKSNYVVFLPHYQLLLRLGVQITKIHQVLQYKQDFYMMDYIRIIAQWRKDATNCFQSSLFKNLGNFIPGKMAEKQLGRKSIEIVLNEKRLEKLVRKGNFHDRQIFNFPNFDMVLVEMTKPVVTLDRPLIISAVVWSMSKVHLYSYWYFTLKPKFGPSLSLIACDTDNYIYCYDTNDYVADLFSLREHFDFSNLDPSSVLYNTDNKRVLGKLKLESSGKRVLAACCLKSKVYSLLFEDSSVNKLKGIQKHYAKNVLTFEDYKSCVLSKTVRFARYKSIISKEHNIYTVTQSKLALECTDYKRHILPDGINTLAHHHYRIGS
jgi:hypothetical protein